MLDGVKARAFGEHPAGEDPLHVAVELDLVNLDEGGGVGRLGRWAGVAHAGRDFQGAKRDGLIDRNFEMGNASCHLVEGGKHGNLVFDDLGMGRARCEHEGERREGKSRACQAQRLRFPSFDHATRLLNRPVDCRRGIVRAVCMTPP
jgi:hypothetical protein